MRLTDKTVGHTRTANCCCYWDTELKTATGSKKKKKERVSTCDTHTWSLNEILLRLMSSGFFPNVHPQHVDIAFPLSSSNVMIGNSHSGGLWWVASWGLASSVTIVDVAKRVVHSCKVGLLFCTVISLCLNRIGKTKNLLSSAKEMKIIIHAKHLWRTPYTNSLSGCERLCCLGVEIGAHCDYLVKLSHSKFSYFLTSPVSAVPPEVAW